MERQLNAYLAHLKDQERSSRTRQQYQRDIRHFLRHASDTIWNKETVIQYKRALQRKYRPSSVNAKLAAVNGFLTFIGMDGLRVRQLRVQHRSYCPEEKELTKAEYLRLLQAAKQQKDERLSLLVQTICSTGIRVSELQFITVQAVNRGEAQICLKGKTRTILIAGKLRKALTRYLQREKIATGPLFVTRSGRPLDRSNIWKMLKALSGRAGVDAQKVFPHNLRHLFARCFYAIDKDLAKLADILGHSNINTTRIYIISSGQEHLQRMDALGLVV